MTERAALNPAAFADRLRHLGSAAYHDRHPFHRLMHEGKLTRIQLQAWVRNRYYYHAMIPKKDAALLQNSDDPAFRRVWAQRLLDNDGRGDGEVSGGLQKWLNLAQATGLDTQEVRNFVGVLPGVRFAVDAYVEFVRTHSLLEGVASSLTELFAGGLHALRVPLFAEAYPWVHPAGLAYFKTRVAQVPKEAAWGLAYVVQHATCAPRQLACEAALLYKCTILWSLLDSVYFAYVEPGWPPPTWQQFNETGDSP